MSMTLGTETGSLMNHVYSGGANPAPEVGMGATILHWTDRSAGTVIYVSPSGKTAKIQEDTAVRIDKNGMSEMQTYTYTPNPTGHIHTARLTKRGWKAAGLGVTFGFRRAYHDFSF